MNRFVADPEWHGLIVAYFFLGGIAAGAFAAACLAHLFGDDADRRATRPAHYLAFPLVAVCGLLLIADLGRPERFWHMMLQSRTWRPMFKWWSPMSVGSWGLSAFGAFAFAAFVGALAEDGRLGLGRFAGLARRLWAGRTGLAFAAGGLLSAWFLGAYTGTLLSASNEPIWADSTWLSPLFLASAISTGVAATVLLGRWLDRGVPETGRDRLERFDTFALMLEAGLLAAFALSLGGLALEAFRTWPGALVPAFVVPFGLIAPLLLRFRPRHATRLGVLLPAILVLAGGLALRAAIVLIPGPMLGVHP